MYTAGFEGAVMILSSGTREDGNRDTHCMYTLTQRHQEIMATWILIKKKIREKCLGVEIAERKSTTHVD